MTKCEKHIKMIYFCIQKNNNILFVNMRTLLENRNVELHNAIQGISSQSIENV